VEISFRENTLPLRAGTRRALASSNVVKPA